MLLFIALPILLVLAVWIAWPWVAAWQIARWLPLPMSWSGRDGYFAIVDAHGGPRPDDGVVQAHLTAPVHRLRIFLEDLLAWKVPPGAMRGGFSVHGTWAWNELGPGPRSWQAESVWWGARAHLAIRQPIADVNRMIAYRLSLQPDSPLTRVALTSIRISDDDAAEADPLARRFALEGIGSITCRYLGMNHDVNVRRCTALLHVRFEKIPGGLRPTARLEITELDTPMLSIPIIGQIRRIIIPAIEEAANRSLAQRLDGVIAPAWIPTDLRIEAVGR